MRFLRDNGLSLFFGTIFIASVAGQSFAGRASLNAERADHREAAVSYWRYVTSSDFGQALLENWQSEFLQFTLFILATVWLVQRGSNESKKLDQVGLESDERQRLGAHVEEGSPGWTKAGGWRARVYSNSLLLVMFAIFLTSWLGQSVTGWTKYNDEQRLHGDQPVSWFRYVERPDFWEETLQNWQSEFLAVGAMTIFTVYLRQRGSAESKPVGAPHDETAASG